jgi:hypothetical protein
MDLSPDDQHRLVVDVVARPDYTIRYEQWAEDIFVHVEVRRWSHKVARAFRQDIDAAHRLLSKPVYALFVPEAQNAHFMRSHGFIRVGDAIDIHGRRVGLHRRNCPDG